MARETYTDKQMIAFYRGIIRDAQKEIHGDDWLGVGRVLGRQLCGDEPCEMLDEKHAKRIELPCAINKDGEEWRGLKVAVTDALYIFWMYHVSQPDSARSTICKILNAVTKGGTY